MELFYRILEVINYVIIGICTTAFFFQIVMILFFWLPEKHFPKAEKQAKIAVIFMAKDEEEVIGKTISSFLEGQDYPKELYDLYVVADNCSDKTAEIAASAGAEVLVHTDPDPKHARKAYGIQYGLSTLRSLGKGYDFYLLFDADNRADPHYLSAMNDAYQSGVEIARPFEASSNAGQNAWTSVSAGYYLRDSFIASNFRERLHLDSMLTGAGMMVADKILEEIPNSYDCVTMAEDAEFTVKRLLKKKRVHYVGDAIVYEDQPATLKDTISRLTRMGHGLNHLFFTKGFPLFGHFFVSGRWSNIDLFVQILMIPVAVLCCLWFPAYYIFYVLLHLSNAIGPEFLGGYMNIGGAYMTSEMSWQLLWDLMKMILIVLGAYLVLYPFQTWVCVLRSKKKLGLPSLKGYVSGILLSPLFMIVYALAITAGALSKPKWKKIKRSSE